MQYASRVKIGQKIVINYGEKNIISHITQILPEVDETTQRVVLLSSTDEKVSNLYINAYTKATLHFQANETYVAVRKSALSFFKNEWVVFIPKEEQEHEHEQEHHEKEISFEVRVVEIVAQDENYVGVKGLEVNQEYVSDKSYYVKSMMLKSSLGGHGH